ncbi:MAG: hypothetical protein Q8K78_10170 [Planctomycetaceae bacterium]|nr:hypothetical protein [Planctomycetaceae bacterium]
MMIRTRTSMWCAACLGVFLTGSLLSVFGQTAPTAKPPESVNETTAVAGPFTGGFFGTGVPGPNDRPGQLRRDVWEGVHFIISVSESKRTLYGYSSLSDRGQWDAIAIDPAEGNAVLPTLSTEVACAIVGKRAYAFSAHTGRWADVDLGFAGAEKRCAINQHHIEIANGTRHWMFSSKSGRWAMIDRAVDLPR